MADTSIEWADSVWNPVVGCTPVSAGCLNCYAATMARRHVGMGTPGYEDRDGIRIAETRGGRAVFTGSVRCLEDRLTEPLRWRKPRRIFVCSMSDLFHEAVPFEFIDRVWSVICFAPQHTFLVLTKRPDRMAEYLGSSHRYERIVETYTTLLRERLIAAKAANAASKHLASVYGEGNHGFASVAPENVWLGTSVEDQKAAEERIPHLLRCPAAVRFLSVEPLLGPVSIFEGGCPHPVQTPRGELLPPGAIHWTIVGGESGPKARPCDVAWIRGIVRQCSEAGVPCFVKQIGSRAEWTNDDGEKVSMHCGDRKGGDPSEWPEDLRVRQWPEVRRA